jgi:hypothetical protein
MHGQGRKNASEQDAPTFSSSLGRARVVPEELKLTSELSTARRRLGSISLLAAGLLVVYLAVYVLFLAGSRLTMVLTGVEIALFAVTRTLCRTKRITDRRATDLSLVLWIVATWLTSVVQHLGYDGRIDTFTSALFPVFLMPLFSGVGRSRFIPAILLMGAAQPAVAWWAHRAEATLGSDRDLVFSFIGATVVMALSWGGSVMMHVARQEGARDVGGYRLVRRVGVGGMGEVWEGQHRFLARPAAIKLFSPTPETARPELMLRFEREAQATALLTSEHTVRLFDFGRAEDGRLYYVMELLEGLDLQRLVEQRGPLSPAHVVSIMLQVCDSLGEAHQDGFVHRDLKPSNIFLARRGLRSDFVKVLDFGLVSIQDLGSSLTQADASIFLGTVNYASPEALRGEKQSPQSDVYQLGCVMFFLLTGHIVFERPSTVAVALAHSAEAPPHVGSFVEHPIPEDFEALIQRCLAKVPSHRPSTAIALAEELTELACYGQWSRADEQHYFDSIVFGRAPAAQKALTQTSLRS